MQAIIEDEATEPGFTNSVVFNLVMRRNPDLCKEVVETALGFELSKISYIETEKTIQPKLTSKNVRLDVVAKADGKMIDIEMQVAYEPSLARRARYYESAMDTDALKSGISYHELPESYVIFFCKGAPFGKGCAERRFVMMDALHPTEKMALDDGRTVVVLSAGNWVEVESPSLSKLLKYIHTGNVDDGSDNLTSRLENAVRELREDEDNMGYMTFAEQMEIMERTQALQNEKLAEQDERLAEKEEQIGRGQSIKELAVRLISEGRGEEFMEAASDEAAMERLLNDGE